jgi:hypothetical protein
MFTPHNLVTIAHAHTCTLSQSKAVVTNKKSEDEDGLKKLR